VCFRIILHCPCQNSPTSKTPHLMQRSLRYLLHNNGFFYNFKFSSFFVFCVSVKVKLTIPLLCFVCILPRKAVLEMIYTVSGGALKPSHSLTH